MVTLKSIICGKSITCYTKRRIKMAKEKYVGICKVGEKGQVVIPKEIRKLFDINAGDSIIVLADKQKGIALLKADAIENLTEDRKSHV